MGCKKCEVLKKRVVELEKLLHGKTDRTIRHIARGGKHVYSYAGCQISFDTKRGLWIALYKDKEIASDFTLNKTQETVREWRLKQQHPDDRSSYWTGNSKPVKYMGSILEKKEGVWYINNEKTDLTSQQDVRNFIKTKALGHVPIELKNKRTPYELTGISVQREEWEGVDYWVVRVYGGIFSKGKPGSHRKFFSIKKFGVRKAEKMANDYKKKLVEKYGIKKPANQRRRQKS